MQSINLNLYQWFLNIPYRSLEKAYQTSKKVRNIQKDYLYYKNNISSSSRRSWYNVGIYLNNVLNQSASEIYWNLVEFKISKYICSLLEKFWIHNKQDYDLLKKNSKISPSLSEEYLYFSSFENRYDQLDDVNRKLSWIEAVLEDLESLKNESWNLSNLRSQDVTTTILSPFSWSNFLLKPKETSYESLGLVPRSITRTLSRFQKELEGRSASLVLPEFRLAKYQAVASLQYMIFLFFCPWFISTLCKILFLEPWIENWWNTSQSQVFLSFSQEEKALRRLQEVEELLWLDIIMADSSTRQPQDLSAQIHQKTIDLVETYNQESINTVLHLFTNFIALSVIISLLIWGKKRLAILNSWVQEVFYSLSDTMKAFFILLLTDLCIGFHSPHGWEIFIGLLLEYLGFSHNKQVISCFVSTFPVILDTVFKYWIFRHLNRISPSIVVSYHTMNE
jgi:hypothetical protein